MMMTYFDYLNQDTEQLLENARWRFPVYLPNDNDRFESIYPHQFLDIHAFMIKRANKSYFIDNPLGQEVGHLINWLLVRRGIDHSKLSLRNKKLLSQMESALYDVREKLRIENGYYLPKESK